MKVAIKFDIDLKVLFRNPDDWRVPVLGLTYFHVCPAGKGLGRDALTILTQMAERMDCECVVTYIGDEKDLEFYQKCGWFVKEKVNGKYLVSSKDISFNESLSERW